MLSPEITYLIFPVTGAVLGAMLWINYFKKIDVLEKERTIDLLLAFSIGYLTPTLALWMYYVLEVLGFNFNGDLLNDLLYSVFGVGFTEEIVKLLGVLLTFKLLKKRINEPIDYLIFGGIVALGFSIRENFIYYNNYGSQIMTGRTLISCLVHIINTSVCVYGIYRFKSFNKGNPFINSLVGIAVAILSHGLFDFFLTQPIIGSLTPFLSTIVYLIGINFWIQMMNNSINFSPFFNYAIISTSTRLYTSVALWYLAIIILEFSYAAYYKDLTYALIDSGKNLLNEGILIIIVALRISRLKISHRKYFPIKIQSPIFYTKNDDEDFNFFGIPLKIRGENEHEFLFLKFVGKNILICPISSKNTHITENTKARVLKKYYLKNDVVTYLIEVFSDKNTDGKIYLLKPKTRGLTMVENKFPIGLLAEYDPKSLFKTEHESISYKELKLLELIYVKEE